jgi:OOP family OmpA-OmpF porin
MLAGRRHLVRLGRVALASALVTAGLIAFARAAQAQPLIERFDPAERGSRFFVADSLELDGNNRFAAGVVASYGSHLRTFRQTGDSEQSTLITNSFWLHPGVSFVMAPGARFALDIPIAMQTGNDVSLDKTFYPSPASPAFGDIKASFDLRIAGRERPDIDGASVAIGVSAYVPTGSASDYASDDFARVAVRLATSGQRGPILGAARVGLMYRKDELDSIGGVRLGTEANAVLALGYHTGALVVGPEVHGLTTLKEAFERRSTPTEVLFGVHLGLGGALVGAGIGTLLVSGLGAPKIRGVLSVEWAPGSEPPRDRDHDGVMDADDMCPDVPGASTALGSRGCPPAPTDTDGDGIIDSEDACPQVRGERSRDPMTHGCPDADHDGIPDPVDACPNVPGERSVLPRFNGCPPDSDGDGIADIDDACPDEPGVASDDPAKNGCAAPPPPPPDRDGDGVPDADDACPDVAGPKSEVLALTGCPLVKPEGSSTLQLGFDGATSQLLPDSDRLLAKSAAMLVAFPDVRVFVVVAAAAGAKLDAKRTPALTKAVIARLVELGVAKTRFDAHRATGAAQKNQLELRVQPDGTH